MFTGIIEAFGEVVAFSDQGDNRTFTIQSAISSELKIDQSLAHDGVCLTVTRVHGDQHDVVAIRETMDRSSLGQWRQGTRVNLERAMMMNGRLDGHIVQGHVDATGKCILVEDKAGSWRYCFEFDREFAALIVPKGSICINGISLTANEPSTDRFYVDIIPYTYDNTNVHQWREGTLVNLEFDILGKYVQRMVNTSVAS